MATGQLVAGVRPRRDSIVRLCPNLVTQQIKGQSPVTHIGAVEAAEADRRFEIAHRLLRVLQLDQRRAHRCLYHRIARGQRLRPC